MHIVSPRDNTAASSVVLASGESPIRVQHSLKGHQKRTFSTMSVEEEEEKEEAPTSEHTSWAATDISPQEFRPGSGSSPVCPEEMQHVPRRRQHVEQGQQGAAGMQCEEAEGQLVQGEDQPPMPALVSEMNILEDQALLGWHEDLWSLGDIFEDEDAVTTTSSFHGFHPHMPGNGSWSLGDTFKEEDAASFEGHPSCTPEGLPWGSFHDQNAASSSSCDGHYFRLFDLNY